MATEKKKGFFGLFRTKSQKEEPITVEKKEGKPPIGKQQLGPPSASSNSNKTQLSETQRPAADQPGPQRPPSRKVPEPPPSPPPLRIASVVTAKTDPAETTISPKGHGSNLFEKHEANKDNPDNENLNFILKKNSFEISNLKKNAGYLNEEEEEAPDWIIQLVRSQLSDQETGTANEENTQEILNESYLSKDEIDPPDQKIQCVVPEAAPPSENSAKELPNEKESAPNIFKPEKKGPEERSGLERQRTVKSLLQQFEGTKPVRETPSLAKVKAEDKQSTKTTPRQSEESEKLPSPLLSIISPSVKPPSSLPYTFKPLQDSLYPQESSVSLPPTLLPLKSPAKSPGEKISKQTPAIEDDFEAFYPSDLSLIRHLERGTQGAVDLVSTKFFRKVAVKYFDVRVKQWEHIATRELCYLLKTVTHPHVVQFRGVLYSSPSQKEAPLGILMEYMDCGSVHDSIYNAELNYTITEPLNWCRQAASALAFLHKKRLVHRDVKPGNMLLCEGGKKLKISDFGLCSAVANTMTADVGTVIYMAPEVVRRGSNVSYDESCDVYSLGLSVWEMIHRQMPHEGFGLLDLLSAVRDGVRPSFNADRCPKEVQKLIERMWTEESSARPKMEEVFETVAGLLEKSGFFESDCY